MLCPKSITCLLIHLQLRKQNNFFDIDRSSNGTLVCDQYQVQLLLSATFITQKLMIIETYHQVKLSYRLTQIVENRVASEAFPSDAHIQIHLCKERAQRWLVKRLQGCRGWLRSSTDWQTKCAGDWGWESWEVGVWVRGGVRSLVIHVFSNSQTGVTVESQMRSLEIRRVAFTVSSSSSYKMLQWENKF